MLADYSILLIGAILVNNFVLVQFLGLCPFMGVSRKLESALGMAAATTFVLTVSAACSYLVDTYLLAPLDLEYLRTIAFILVIAAVVQFTRTAALELAAHDIRVNAICPGYFVTDLNRDWFKTEDGQALIRRIPQRRTGELDQLNGPLLLLASDAGSLMTGSAVTVDGGHVLSDL